MRKALAPLAAILFLAAAPLSADTRAAADAYKKGQALQNARQYGQAIGQYQEALKQDPRYAWAYKGMGTSYYAAGDKASALKCYDLYLRANPVDANTQAFADRLRAELKGGEAAGLPPDKKPALHSGFSLGGGFGVLLAGADDLNKPSAGCAGCGSYAGTTALMEDFDLDYAFGAFALGAEIMVGPTRSHNLSAAGTTVVTTVGNLGLWLNPSYRILMGRSFWIEPRLGLGYLMSAVAFSGASSAGVYTGTGFGVWPQVNFVKMFSRRFGGSLGLGYMISSVSPLKNSLTGTDVTYTNAAGAKETFGLSTGGPTIHVGLNFYFKAPIE
jgi:hypothetical protein